MQFRNDQAPSGVDIAPVLKYRFGWRAASLGLGRTAGSVMAVLVLHTAINFWPSVVPVLPTDASYRAYALVVAILVVLALLALLASGLTAGGRSVGRLPGFAEAPVCGDRIESP